MSEYWFARRYPLDSPRASVAPVSWKGWAAFGVFAAFDMAGGLLFALLAFHANFMAGLALFIGLTLMGAGALMFLVLTKSDYHRTVEEYRQPRLVE